MYYLGFIAFEKNDKSESPTPFFLGVNSKGEFGPIDWSFADMEDISERKATGKPLPSYLKEDDFVADISCLWVQTREDDPQKDESYKFVSKLLIKSLEVIFPDYRWTTTIYPEKTMKKYFFYRGDSDSLYYMFDQKLASAKVEE